MYRPEYWMEIFHGIENNIYISIPEKHTWFLIWHQFNRDYLPG